MKKNFDVAAPGQAPMIFKPTSTFRFIIFIIYFYHNTFVTPNTNPPRISQHKTFKFGLSIATLLNNPSA